MKKTELPAPAEAEGPGDFSQKVRRFAKSAESRFSGIVLPVCRLWQNREGDFSQKRVFLYKSKDCAKLPVFPTFLEVFIAQVSPL